jgi:hypothetical protein
MALGLDSPTVVSFPPENPQVPYRYYEMFSSSATC